MPKQKPPKKPRIYRKTLDKPHIFTNLRYSHRKPPLQSPPKSLGQPQPPFQARLIILYPAKDSGSMALRAARVPLTLYLGGYHVTDGLKTKKHPAHAGCNSNYINYGCTAWTVEPLAFAMASDTSSLLRPAASVGTLEVPVIP